MGFFNKIDNSMDVNTLEELWNQEYDRSHEAM